MPNEKPKKSRWTRYPGLPNRVNSDAPRVTLNHRKVFLLNRKAVEALGSPSKVELLYDEETRTIGLAPIDPRTLSAFPLKGKETVKKYSYRIIHAAPFCKLFDINPKGTLLFTDVDLDNEGTLLLELKTTVPIGRGFR
jgi:hypothetical protein